MKKLLSAVVIGAASLTISSAALANIYYNPYYAGVGVYGTGLDVVGVTSGILAGAAGPGWGYGYGPAYGTNVGTCCATPVRYRCCSYNYNRCYRPHRYCYYR